MSNTLLPMSIVWLTLGISLVPISGIPGEGMSTIVSRKDLSTTLKTNDSVQHSVGDDETKVLESPHGTQQIDNNTITNSLINKMKPKTPFFWTPSSPTEYSAIQFTGSNKSLTIDTSIEVNEDADSNNITNKKDWITQPPWPVLDSELDNGQSDEAKQLISKKTADDLIFVFYYILEQPVAVAGCVCNIFNIIVLKKQGFSASTACYLFAMTLADLTFLVFTLVVCVFTSLKNHNYPAYVQWATWMHHDFFRRFFLITSARISNYFVAVLSIERFIAVRFPLSIKFTPLARYPKTIITGVCVFVSALLVPNIFRTEFTEIQEPHINTTITKYTLTAFHNSYLEFYVYYTNFMLAFLRLLPILVVFILNVGIIITLKGSSTNIENMRAGDTKRQVKQIKITRMLVAIAVIFLICILPGLVHSLLTIFYRPYYSDNQNLWAAVHHIYPLFEIINSTVNFIVYILLSEKFYAIFIDTFCLMRAKQKQQQIFSLNSSTLGGTENAPI